MNHITILNRNIQKNEGLYSLNDLHKAAGNEPRHQPNRFFRLEQTQELLAELNYPHLGSLILKQTKGRNGGTFACKEIVIAYGAWISPIFHLAVIQTFLASGQQNEQMQQMQAAIVQLQQQQAKVLAILESNQQLTLASKPDIRLRARLTAAQEQEILQLVQQGYCKTDIAKQFSVSRTTVYRVISSRIH